MKVAVVILNWNGRKFLEQFLPSVVANNSPMAEVIVADNNSTDDSVNFLKEHYPTIRVVQNTTNGGFAKGYNDALKQIDATYYILLNSDVEVTPDWIDPIIEMMDADSSIAACQPKIKDYNNKEYFEYAGAAGGHLDLNGYPFCRGRIFDTVEKDKGQYNDVAEIFWATGACMFIRAEYYHAANGLDEDFFAHMEEIDLCWRLKNMGYKIMYNPNCTVYHVGGGTLSKENPYKTYLNFRNNLFLLCKNQESRYLFFKLLMRFILDGIAGVKFLAAGQVSNCMAIVKAHFSFYGAVGVLLKKRKLLNKTLKTHSKDKLYQKSVLIEYFLKGKKRFSEL